MEFTQDQLAAVIGSQQLEIISLRMQLAKLTEELSKYKLQDGTPIPELKAVS